MPMQRQSPRHCGFRYGSAAASAEALRAVPRAELEPGAMRRVGGLALETGGVLPRQDAEEFLRAAAADEVDAPVPRDDGARIDRQPRKARELAGGGLRFMAGKRRHQFAGVQQGKQSAHGRCPTDDGYCPVHRRTPRGVFRQFPAHGLYEDALKLLRDRAGPAVADLAPVHLDQRSDLRAGAAEERLVGGVELRAADAALDHVAAHLVPDQLADHAPRDAFQVVLLRGRRDERAAAHEEDVLRARLGNVSVLRQENRLVITVHLRLVARQGAVEVGAGGLRARRDHVLRDAPPARDARRHALRRVQVVPQRQRVHGEFDAVGRQRGRKEFRSC